MTEVEVIANHYVLIGDAADRGSVNSSVRRAFDRRDGASVAVKFLVGGRDDIMQILFRREVDSLQALDHPNIIKLRASGFEEETATPYLVFDWYEVSLADVLREQGPFRWDAFAPNIALPLVSALECSHLNGVEHRDVKPANVLMTSVGTPVLADFGIGKDTAIPATPEATVAMFRSGPYAPPEVDSVKRYVRDVFAMGVLIIQCLHTETLTELHEVTDALEAIAVPPDVRKLLAQCISVDPEERPESGSRLAEELRRVMRSGVRRSDRIRNVQHLRLTAAARTKLIKSGSVKTESDCEGAVGLDLSGNVFAHYKWDSVSKSVDSDTVIVIGNSRRYVLKQDGSQWVAVTADELEFEALESLRRRSIDLGDHFEWNLGQPRDMGAAQAAVASLRSQLSAFHADVPVSDADPAVAEFLGAWERLLDARESLERGERKPVRYDSRVQTDREAEFSLIETVETDLVGSEIEVIDDDRRWRMGRGDVVIQGEKTLTVRFHRAIGNLPARGTISPSLGPSETALNRQRDAITSLRDGTASKPGLAELILDPSTVTPPNPVRIDTWSSDLDESKRSAVEAALGSPDVLLVQGPPGTGKTKFITETVIQALRANPQARILIVSQTHVAVDNALERLEAAQVNGLVRLGIPDDPRVAKGTQHLLLPEQMRRWAENVRKRAERALQVIADTQGVPTKHLHAALALEELITHLRTRERIESHIADLELVAHGADLAATLSASEELSELRDRLADVALNCKESAARAQQMQSDLTVHPDMDITEAKVALDLLIDPATEAKKLLRLLELQVNWLQRIAADQNLEYAFVKTVNVVAGTCIGFLSHPAIRDVQFDICILDEASKATATEAIVPLARANQWILVGDTRQLPPVDEEILHNQTIRDDYQLTKELVSETLFQRMAGLLPESNQLKLREQYRMVAPIGDLISECFYDGDLISPMSGGLPGLELLCKPVRWLDTRPLGEQRREDRAGGGKSFANRSESRIVLRHLESLDGAIAKGVVKVPEGDKLSVLLVAPYRSQVSELQRRLMGSRLDNLDIDIQTVDAVQGREADIVFFSVTRSNADGKFGFLGLEFWRRINVALSRARYGLTIVGDSEFCQSAPGALKDVVRYIRTHPQECEIRSATDA